MKNVFTDRLLRHCADASVNLSTRWRVLFQGEFRRFTASIQASEPNSFVRVIRSVFGNRLALSKVHHASSNKRTWRSAERIPWDSGSLPQSAPPRGGGKGQRAQFNELKKTLDQTTPSDDEVRGCRSPS
jgi:hypothetical protein